MVQLWNDWPFLFKRSLRRVFLALFLFGVSSALPGCTAIPEPRNSDPLLIPARPLVPNKATSIFTAYCQVGEARIVVLHERDEELDGALSSRVSFASFQGGLAIKDLEEVNKSIGKRYVTKLSISCSEYAEFLIEFQGQSVREIPDQLRFTVRKGELLGVRQ